MRHGILEEEGEYCYQCKSKPEELYKCDKCPRVTCFDCMWYGACEACWFDMTKDVYYGPYD